MGVRKKMYISLIQQIKEYQKSLTRQEGVVNAKL